LRTRAERRKTGAQNRIRGSRLHGLVVGLVHETVGTAIPTVSLLHGCQHKIARILRRGGITAVNDPIAHGWGPRRRLVVAGETSISSAIDEFGTLVDERGLLVGRRAGVPLAVGRNQSLTPVNHDDQSITLEAGEVRYEWERSRRLEPTQDR
jgi:hypothetical protein